MKNKVDFQWILWILKKHENICNSGKVFQNINISSFFYSQRAVNPVISNLQEIILGKEFSLNFEGKKSFKLAQNCTFSCFYVYQEV